MINQRLLLAVERPIQGPLVSGRDCRLLLFSIACALLCWVGLPGANAHAQCTHVKTYRLSGSNLNIRSTSNTSGSIKGNVPEGTCLKVNNKTTGQNINGDTTWYNITHNGVTGWISGYYAQCSTCGGPPPECSVGQTKACYSGPSGTRNKGLCKDGVQPCVAGKWGQCTGDQTPVNERCDGKDNDCDGSTDEGNPGGGASCSTGQPGACGQGIQTCQNGSLRCVGSTPSSAELCDGKDNNCNGSIDEGNPEGGKSCNTGTPGSCSQGLSQCKNGKITCAPLQTGGNELCDGKDNDCNGMIDDGLKRACYTGPANTNGVGICTGGEQRCKSGQWGVCDGELTPQSQEICGNQKDDNCNGQTDENCNGQQGCVDGQTQSCYTGPPGTQGKGYCQAGTQLCAAGQWQSCRNERTPAASEICNNNTDDNCNGQVDENCQVQQGCVDADQDGSGVGIDCKGPQDCDDNDPEVNPSRSEICGNNKDDDCKDGDLPCGKLPLGEAGCTKPSDCASDFCVKLGTIQRCSQACQISADCPAGYTCIQGKACWPPKKETPEPAKPCQVNAQCANTEYCADGFCVPGRRGCSCSTASQETPLTPWLALLLLFGWGIRRRISRRIR